MLRALAAPVFTLADVMDLTVDKLYGGPGYPAERGHVERPRTMGHHMEGGPLGGKQVFQEMQHQDPRHVHPNLFRTTY